MHCQCSSKYIIFHCPNWDGLHVSCALAWVALPRPPTLRTSFAALSSRNSQRTRQKATVLSKAEETFRLFYKMVEEILTLKEVEERACQAADTVDN